MTENNKGGGGYRWGGGYMWGRGVIGGGGQVYAVAWPWPCTATFFVRMSTFCRMSSSFAA